MDLLLKLSQFVGIFLLFVLVLWVVRIFPIVKFLALILNFRPNRDSIPDEKVQYTFATKMHWWILTTDKKNRESVRYSSLYGSFLQLSNFMNVPFSLTIWGIKLLSVYKGWLKVKISSLKITKPLKHVTRVTMYQCTESALRKLPVSHKLRPELENELKQIVDRAIIQARSGDITSSYNLLRALISIPGTQNGFAGFVSRIGILVGKRESRLIGFQVCKQRNFTVKEALSLIPTPARNQSAKESH